MSRKWIRCIVLSFACEAQLRDEWLLHHSGGGSSCIVCVAFSEFPSHAANFLSSVTYGFQSNDECIETNLTFGYLLAHSSVGDELEESSDVGRNRHYERDFRGIDASTRNTR